MARTAQTYIWQKSVGLGWLFQNEAHLAELTAGSFTIIERPGRKRMMVESACSSRAAADRLVRIFGGQREMLPRDWLDRFRRGNATKPLRIGNRLVITNEEDPCARREPGRQAPSHFLSIPAGAAFGTGEHATTAMSLRLLERVTRGLAPGWRMLDAGTGSGILALAAARFGAQSIVAIDNDPMAISAARQNARVNGIRTVRFVLGDAKQSVNGRFDIVTANLFSELLAEMLPKFSRCLAPDGWLILSGVLCQQEAGLARSLRSNGFRIQETRRRGKWIALLAEPLPTPAPDLDPTLARRSAARLRARSGSRAGVERKNAFDATEP